MKQDKKRNIQRAGILVFLIIPVLMYAKYYLNDQLPGSADLAQFFSAKKYFSQCLMRGEFPQWNGYVANGMPWTGNMYIVNLILSFLPLKQYVYAYFVLHLFMGSFFFYLYLRECKCSYTVSMVFATIFECSIQINGLRKGHPSIITAICLFPVIIFLVKKFFNTRESKWLWFSAIAAGVQMIAGKQYSVYALLILVIYILVNCIRDKFSVKEIIQKGIVWLVLFVGTSAVDLLSDFSILGEYKQYGSTGISYETFNTFSIHPVKLIQMVIPNFFGSIYQPLGNYYSSELDIEMYLGIFVLLLAISVVVIHKKRVDIKLDVACAVFAFFFAARAHIPVVNEIIFRLPVLGGLRCAGRMLYLFYFFVLSLAAKGLDSMLEEDQKELQLLCVKKLAHILFCSIIILGASAAFVVSMTTSNDKLPEYYYKIQDALFLPLVFLVIILAVIYLIRKKVYERFSWKINSRNVVLCGAVLIITLAEILPFSLQTEILPIAQLEATHPTEGLLQKDIGNYKILDAFGNVDGAHESIISQNKSTVKEIAAINSYTAYNNPLVFKYFKNLGPNVKEAPFNFSGLLTGSQSIANNVLFQNDLLSMLGVRYLIDSDHVIENYGGRFFGSQCRTVPVASKENISLDFLENGIGVSILSGGIAPNTCYKINLKINEEDNAALTFLAADLFGGDDYDLAPQEKQFYLTKQSNEYVAYLFSDHAERATEDIRIRVLAQSEAKQVRIEKCEISIVEPQTYQYWNTDRYGNKIYENINAKDILYFPKQVVQMDSFDDIYDNYEKYDLSNTAYVDRESQELDNTNAVVQINSRTSNVLSAEVSSDSDSYLCFSQNYSSNWTVEIDGEASKPEMVNGLIMGTAIPAGEHTVVFRYSDPWGIAGICITLLTVLSLVCVVFIDKRRKKID